MTQNKINRLRKEIDDIDNQLLDLVRKRLFLTKEIGDIKKEKQIDIIDISREKELFQALRQKCQDLNLDPQIIENIWHQILKASYKSQE